MFEYPTNTTCLECGASKAPNRYRKCPNCHRAYRDGIHRMHPSPYYLAPLGSKR